MYMGWLGLHGGLLRGSQKTVQITVQRDILPGDEDDDDDVFMYSLDTFYMIIESFFSPI